MAAPKARPTERPQQDAQRDVTAPVLNVDPQAASVIPPAQVSWPVTPPLPREATCHSLIRWQALQERYWQGLEPR